MKKTIILLLKKIEERKEYESGNGDFDEMLDGNQKTIYSFITRGRHNGFDV